MIKLLLDGVLTFFFFIDKYGFGIIYSVCLPCTCPVQPPSRRTVTKNVHGKGQRGLKGDDNNPPHCCSVPHHAHAGLPPFWEQRVEQGKPAFYNTITCSSQPRKPAPVHGGILSDDMGLVRHWLLLMIVVVVVVRGDGVTVVVVQL